MRGSPVESPSQPYDLLWPVGRRREVHRTGKGIAGKVEEVKAGGDGSITNGERESSHGASFRGLMTLNFYRLPK